MRCVESRKYRKDSQLGSSVVNTRGNQETLSILTTQINKPIHANDSSNLMELIVDRENLKLALKRVEGNRGAPGINGMTTKELRAYIKLNWEQIKQELLEGTYKPSPVRRVEIPKSCGGIRQLGIPIVVDRFIQQAISQVLTPIFEATFSSYSYGFRPGRNAKQALAQAQEYVRAGRKIVVDMDIEKFFDRVNHDILMSKLAARVKDKRVLRLIRRYLESGIMTDGCFAETKEGTPQGGPLSPLLSNIMLHELDQELEKRGHCFVRYADDCNVYVASKRAGDRVYASITKFLEKRLKLKVNVLKSAVDKPWNRKFLGFVIGFSSKHKLWLAPKTKERLKDKIRQLTNRSWGISMEDRIKKINEYLIGWFGYFKSAEAERFFEDTDQWLRRRMRACLLKQWKQSKTWLRNLRNLGIAEKWAEKVAYSRKSWWRLANTPQTNKALGHAYWREQGLESLLENYICYKARG